MSARALLVGMLVLPLAAVTIALYTQHRLDMMPCAWCVLQRLILLVIAGLALLGWLMPSLLLRRLAAVLALLAAGAGIAAALWQHFVASVSTSCDQSLADRVMAWSGLDRRYPDVFTAWASCAEAQTMLLGMAYEFYSLSLFIALALMALRVVARPR